LEAAEGALRTAGYKEATIFQYQVAWHGLQAFALSHGYPDALSNDLIEAWLVAKGYPVGRWPSPRPHALVRVVAALRLLVQVYEFGEIMPGRVSNLMFRFAHLGRHRPQRKLQTCIGQSAGEQRIAALAPALRDIFIRYEQDCLARGFRPSSLKNAQLSVPRFFVWLMEQGVTDVSHITATHITTYLTSLEGCVPAYVANQAGHIRCILRFCADQGLMTSEMRTAVPPCPIRDYRKIPTVWTPEDITRLLAQVDRQSPRGKRDYAILLLAARLGMRVGDIIRLTLDDIRWAHKRIELVQTKTSEPLVLPLLDEVGWALIDYLQHARPISEYRHVFLSLAYPYAPFVSHDNLYHLITGYRRKAGIQRYQRQPVGMHTLRHSLATHLLTDDTPLQTISEVLGHTATASTEVYAKVNLAQLQRCALDPEEVMHATS
jgi:site-specific recombinase XerD